MTFLAVPGGRGARRDFCHLLMAYGLEIFSGLSSGSFSFIAEALVMVLKQWGLRLTHKVLKGHFCPPKCSDIH
jgi:hypothetical protein